MHIPPIFLMPFTLAGCVVLAYLIGSIPFGYILGRMYGMGDIRTIGSGNIGATNMLRTGNRNLAAATLALDMSKGFIAPLFCTVLLNMFIRQNFHSTDNVHFALDHSVYFFGLCAVAGHIWPFWLDYKGGKGVATSLGAFLAVAPVVGAVCIACWLVVFYFTRYSSLSSIFAVAVAPLLGAFLVNSNFAWTALFIALLVVFKHKDNIRRLREGTETKWSKP